MTADTPTADDASPDATSRLPRLGVVRAADAVADGTLAEIEARVVRHELVRRLGPVTLDLRTDGPPVGPWLPRIHAAWPADVDATIELDGLGEAARSLVSLFPRTVDPTAADVRSRMLAHLGVLPVAGTLTDDLLTALLPAPARPTDLWLVVRSAADLATAHTAHRRLSEPIDTDIEVIDGWFDTAVDALPGTASPTIASLLAEVRELRALLAATVDELGRTERAALERIEDLTTERDSLGERLERAQLDPAAGSPS